MKKRSYGKAWPVAAAVLLSLQAAAQKGIEGLVNAERQFAWFTASHTVKEGFLKYMDSAGVIFRQGADVNALEAYRRQPAGAGVLSWEPAFAVISASGDLGATSGPYEFRARSASDTVAARGSFSSVWHINRQGEWKNLVDLGTTYSKKPVDIPLQQIVLPKIKTPPATSLEQLWQLDGKFNVALQEKKMTVWMQFISADTRLNIDGRPPAVGMLQIADALQRMPGNLVISTKAGDMSSSGDLAYTYGTVSRGGIKENYLRIWIYRSNQWQMVLQTLKWKE